MDAPVIKNRGVSNAGNGDSSAPLAPGMIVSIQGTNLARTTNFAPAPLPASLDGTQVIIAGQPAPLSAISPQEIRAILPANLPTGTAHQILILRDDAYSVPVSVPVAKAQPAILLVGSAPAIVDAQFRPIGPQNPAHPGDAVIVFATGLGATDPSVVSGTITPVAPLTKAANSVSAAIAGQAAVVTYAGLAPGLVGLYQVNIIIPASVPPSSQIPIVITAAGLSSSPVQIEVSGR